MDQHRLEGEIRRFRFHLTESLRESGEFPSRADAKKAPEGFFRALHREYKIAQEILIAAYLEIEEDMLSATSEGERNQREYWKAVVELCFNTLIWIAIGWERDHAKRIFKGPKHGSASSRNALSVVKVVRKLNEDWNDFAIALDFARFECVADVLRVHLEPATLNPRLDFIEVKEGTVNEQMLDTIQAGSREHYFDFFDKFGASGIKQMERCFRQAKILDDRLKIIGSEGSSTFDTDEGRLFIQLPSAPRIFYLETMKQLLEHMQSDPIGYFVVDDCLLVGGFKVSKPESLSIGDFFLRHSVHHTFSAECSFCLKKGDWMQQFRDIKLFDGLAMFGSVPFEGLIAKPIDDSELLELLFGRIRLFFHLDGDRFIELCKAVGLEAGYLTETESNRMRSKGFKQLIGFRSRFLWMRQKGHELTLYLAEGMLHDMCLNWVHPYWWVRQHVEVPSLSAG